MFYNFIKRNSRKIRKENGIYFTSLIVSIISFYVILSLGEQDVMLYLKTIESEAVSRLLLLIPVLYAVSLFFVFFLVYFANKYQLHLRNHEFGLYLMMGMRRRKLFVLLISETLWNGFIALIIGLPISLFLTEIISLATSKLIGMNIIGYQLRISWVGLSLTIIGFLIIQLIVVFILSFIMSRKEPVDFLNEQKEESQRVLSPLWGSISLLSGSILFLGAIFLCVAYGLAVLYLRDFNYVIFVLILFMGIIGTFILFRGLGSLLGLWIKRRGKSSRGLFVFTGRQLQENVLSQWASLAVSSLLILMAMISFVYGISTAINNSTTSTRTADFTFKGLENEIVSTLSSDKLTTYVKAYYPMKLSHFRPSYSDEFQGEDVNAFSWDGLEKTIAKQADSQEKNNLLNYLSSQDQPYLISVTSYNRLLHSINQLPIQLENDEMALYSDEEFSFSHELIKKALLSNPTVSIKERQYTLLSKLYTSNIVADRAITPSYALIVPDDLYGAFARSSDGTSYWNMVLHEDFVQEKGLMQAMYEVDELLATSNLDYESYLSSMGRQLFFTVAGSYTTFYLGIMFLIIANTVLGLKFLMQQKSTMHRYATVGMLGASVESLCSSAKIQIWLYFGLAIAVALSSSIFGIWSMITAFPNSISMNNGISIVVVTFIVFLIFELCYIGMISRRSDQEIKKLKQIE